MHVAVTPASPFYFRSFRSRRSTGPGRCYWRDSLSAFSRPTPFWRTDLHSKLSCSKSPPWLRASRSGSGFFEEWPYSVSHLRQLLVSPGAWAIIRLKLPARGGWRWERNRANRFSSRGRPSGLILRYLAAFTEAGASEPVAYRVGIRWLPICLRPRLGRHHHW